MVFVSRDSLDLLELLKLIPAGWIRQVVSTAKDRRLLALKFEGLPPDARDLALTFVSMGTHTLSLDPGMRSTRVLLAHELLRDIGADGDGRMYVLDLELYHGLRRSFRLAGRRELVS